MQKFFDIGMKILAVLVIPLILWGIKLEVNLAVMQSELERAQADIEKAESIQEAVSANTMALGRLDEKLGAANLRLGEIKDLLNK